MNEAIDNWLTAMMFLRKIENIMYDRMRRTEPLSADESNAAVDALTSFKRHLETAIEQMGD